MLKLFHRITVKHIFRTSLVVILENTFNISKYLKIFIIQVLEILETLETFFKIILKHILRVRLIVILGSVSIFFNIKNFLPFKYQKG